MIFQKITSSTASQRNLIKLKKIKSLTKTPLLKSKLSKNKTSSGRNNEGKITISHKGNGCKQRYRIIDYHRTQRSTDIVLSIEYDPNRTAFISSLFNNKKNTFKYIITPKGMATGDIVKSGPSVYDCKIGNALPLKNIPVGSILHNVARKPYSKSKLTRAAGTYSKLIKKELNVALISLNSGKFKELSIYCYGTFGIVSNNLKFLATLGKAGRSRWLNNRPVTRGVAMNPIDHPNGGGEGKKSGKKLSPWGKK